MTVEDFLSTYDQKVQDICIALRRIVQEQLPEMEEILFEGWKSIGYGTGESRAAKDLLLYLGPLKDSVNLGFYRGAILPDTKQLLTGTGKLLRHLKIKSLEDFPSEDIKNLIQEAKAERLG